MPFIPGRSSKSVIRSRGLDDPAWWSSCVPRPHGRSGQFEAYRALQIMERGRAKRARFPGRKWGKCPTVNHGIHNTNGKLPMADRFAGPTWSRVWTVWLSLAPWMCFLLWTPRSALGAARDADRQGRSAGRGRRWSTSAARRRSPRRPDRLPAPTPAIASTAWAPAWSSTPRLHLDQPSRGRRRPRDPGHPGRRPAVTSPSWSPATWKPTWPSSRSTPRTPLPVMPIGTSSDLMPGETVIAVGNAYGYEHTVTRGIVSALHRAVQVSDAQYLRQPDPDRREHQSGQLGRAAAEHRRRDDRHQRGGPRRCARHRLRHSRRQGRGRGRRRCWPPATPSKTWIGVASSTEAAPSKQGMVVGAVEAEKPGRRGRAWSPATSSPDVDDTEVRRPLDFQRAMLDRKPGQQVRLAVRRGHDPLALSLTLGECPEAAKPTRPARLGTAGRGTEADLAGRVPRRPSPRVIAAG